MTLSPFSRFFCAFAALTLASSLSAGTIIFQRALPTDGLNATDTSRSNIKWTPGGLDILGDDFTLTHDSVIDTFSVWGVSANTCGNSAGCAATTNPGAEFGSISLYAGSDIGGTGVGTPVPLISSSYTFSLVSGYQFQNAVGIYDVYKISFANLNWSVLGNQLYDFGIGSTPVGTTTGGIRLHGSIFGPVTGSTQDLPDGNIISYTVDGSLNPGSAGPPYILASAFSPGTASDTSDINVEIQGTVPEPATFGMFAIGAGALFFLRRRRA